MTPIPGERGFIRHKSWCKENMKKTQPYHSANVNGPTRGVIAEVKTELL